MTRVQDIYPDDRVILREVGLRDGLQLVKKFPSTAAKQRWVRDEYGAGVRHFEVGSFLPAKTFPQFVDVRDIIKTVAELAGRARHRAGAQRTRRQRGAGIRRRPKSPRWFRRPKSTARPTPTARAIPRSPMSSGCASCATPARTSRSCNAAISMALGCSIVGAVDPNEVIRLVEKCFEAGVDAVGIADTVGYAGPKQVGDLTKAVVRIAGSKPICVHLHDTRGMGIANASAALDAGARILDGSLGGLGGCPFAPGATGNVVFEDLVFLCESKGFATGIDIDRLVAVRAILRVGNAGRAALWRAGPRRIAGPEVGGGGVTVAISPLRQCGEGIASSTRGGTDCASMPICQPLSLISTANHRLIAPSCPAGGALANVTDVGTGCGGRVSAARRAALMRTAKSCGPDAPTLASSAMADRGRR